MSLWLFGLPVGIPYELHQLASEIHNQPKLSAFFPLKNIQDSDDVAPNLGNQVISETENSLLEDRALMVANCPEQCDSTEQVDQCSPEFDGLLHVGPTEMILEMPACSVGSHCEPKGAELYDISRLDRINAGFEPKSSSSCQAFASVCSGIPDDHNFKESSSSRISLASNQPHSTLVDPDFVENYFKVRTCSTFELVRFSVLIFLFFIFFLNFGLSVIFSFCTTYYDFL